MSVKHVTQDNYLQTEIKTEIDQFNQQLDDSLDAANFIVDGGEFESIYLDDIEDDDHLGIVHGDDLNMPSAAEYDDIHTGDRPDDDDEEAMDNYLNVELILDVGNNDE